MISLKNKAMCCGCEACVSACPKKCISFNNDQEGFGYPSVDLDSCINCGRCEAVCPIGKALEIDDLLLAFVGYAYNEETAKKSSSGGVFTAMAKEFLSGGGIVYGAAFDENFKLRHIACHNERELRRITGSKYVQSEIGDSFLQVKADLEQKKRVLFSGTPCQIAGLRQFIGENDNLYTVDLICHATPSPLVWKKYNESMRKKYGGEISRFEFRDKVIGYQFSHFAIYDRQSRIIYKAGTFVNQYLRAFFSGICNRPSCYECKFKTIKRHSDITLGDCFFSRQFGISDKNGANTIIVHSEKGMNLLQSASVKYTAADLDEIVNRHYEITNSAACDERREAFFVDVNAKDIDIVMDEYFPVTIFCLLKYYIRVILKKIGVHDTIKMLYLLVKKNIKKK